MCNISRWESALELYLCLLCFEFLFFSPYKLVILMSFLYSCIFFSHFFSPCARSAGERAHQVVSCWHALPASWGAGEFFISVIFFYFLLCFYCYIKNKQWNSHIFFLNKQVFYWTPWGSFHKKINNISRAGPKERLVQRPGSKLGHLQLQ